MGASLSRDLRRIVGSGRVWTDPEDLVAYRSDATHHRGWPDAVAAVREVAEIAGVVRYAAGRGIPLIPRGAGTGIAGGVVPVQGGIVLDLQSMDRIVEIDDGNLTASVECGVVLGRFHREVEKRGLFYPPDPASLAACTVGGNVATRAGGPRGVKYGTTKDYLLGLEVVLPSGEVLSLGGKNLKNSSGYELMRLFSGSEGTLGVITRVTVRLIPLPPVRRTLLAVFATLEEAAAAVSALIGRGIVPAALEMMDRYTLGSIERFQPAGLPTGVDGLLLVEVDGTEETVRDNIRTIAGLCTRMGSDEVRTAQTDSESQILWGARRAAFPALAHERPTAVVEDVTVPRTRIPAIVRDIRAICRENGVRVAILGHAGDGNMHPIFLTDRRDPLEMARVERALAEVARAALQYGGTLSGEHGIGVSKSRFLEWEVSAGGIKLMQDIKNLIDPHGIFNPGKLWVRKENEPCSS